MFREQSVIYSFCFMSILRLGNMRREVASVWLYSFENVLKVIDQLNGKLQTWRQSLPLKSQCEDCYIPVTEKADSLEHILLKMNYHTTVIFITRILLIKLKDSQQTNLCSSSLKISTLLEECLIFVFQHLHCFLALPFEDLTPLSCHGTRTLMLLSKLKRIAGCKSEPSGDNIGVTDDNQFNCLGIQESVERSQTDSEIFSSLTIY